MPGLVQVAVATEPGALATVDGLPQDFDPVHGDAHSPRPVCLLAPSCRGRALDRIGRSKHKTNLLCTWRRTLLHLGEHPLTSPIGSCKGLLWMEQNVRSSRAEYVAAKVTIRRPHGPTPPGGRDLGCTTCW